MARLSWRKNTPTPFEGMEIESKRATRSIFHSVKTMTNTRAARNYKVAGTLCVIAGLVTLGLGLALKYTSLAAAIPTGGLSLPAAPIGMGMIAAGSSLTALGLAFFKRHRTVKMKANEEGLAKQMDSYAGF